MNTITTRTSSTQSEVNSWAAAMDIVDLFETLGFTTDTPIDPTELKRMISDSIQYYMGGSK